MRTYQLHDTIRVKIEEREREREREVYVSMLTHTHRCAVACISLCVCMSLSSDCLCIDAYSQTGEQQMTCIWVTHRLEELQYADSATLLIDGKVAASGDAANVKRAMTSR